MPLEARYRAALEALPVGYAETGLDGTVRDVNPELCRLLGRPPEQLIGQVARDQIMDDDTRADLLRDLDELVQGRRQWVRRPRTYRNDQGEDVPVWVTTALLRDPHGQPEGYLTFILDNSDVKRSDERFRQGFRASPIGMALLTTDRVFVEVNDSLCATLGYRREDLIGMKVVDIMESAQAADLERRFEIAEATGQWTWMSERTYRSGHGEPVIARVSATRIDDGGGHLMLAQLEDVTAQRLAERELIRQGLHDPLTGLPNRALLDDRLTRALALATAPVTVLMCDVDRFALVNDALGRSAGDQLLARLGRRILGAVDPQCTVARVAGDEFVVVSEGTDAAAADRMTEKLLGAVREPFELAGDEVVLTLSIGVTVHTPTHLPPPTVDELLHDADVALRTAKQTGRNRTTVFDEALRAEADRRTHAERALRRSEPVVHFQPVIDLSSGEPVGFEALCRLYDDSGAPLPPPLFIDVAEQTGVICRLGRKVLELSVAECAQWRTDGHDLHVAVNVSAHQTSEPRFAEDVLELLDEHELEPGRLCLELTESALIEASPRTLRSLHVLHEAGVGIAIDDFGTKYASLRYLQQFPVTALKVDMSFTSGLPAGRSERAIVRAVAQLAHSLDLHCIAEGIETVEQQAFLAGLGVNGQGYLFGRPADAEATAAWLSARGG